MRDCTLMRMTKDEKGLAFIKGLLLKNVLSVCAAYIGIGGMRIEKEPRQ